MHSTATLKNSQQDVVEAESERGRKVYAISWERAYSCAAGFLNVHECVQKIFERTILWDINTHIDTQQLLCINIKQQDDKLINRTSVGFFYTVPILRDEEVPAYISVAHKEEQEI